MPRRDDVKKVLIIGSGPIVIGQACEFDYSGTQACKALRDLGYQIVLVNSNPATIMTDPVMADATYIEPLNIERIEQIIEKEKPDALLPNLGGQTGLNMALQLEKAGILKKHGVEVIGVNLAAIERGEDREIFKRMMDDLGIDTPRSGIATTLAEAEAIAAKIGFPLVIRPAYTMGGAGGGFAYNMEELQTIAARGLDLSMTRQILVEESIKGWEELEVEVVRDADNRMIAVCFIENIDPVGVHTGDSFCVVPMLTAHAQQQRMQDIAFKIVETVGVIGGTNVQLAHNPKNGRMVVIEINPRTSRSSALASKATGFPIALVSAKLAAGLSLADIPYWRDGTLDKYTPSGDYVVLKFARWAFEKFRAVEDKIGTQMKAVGEVMAIGKAYKETLQKAIRGLENGRHGLGFAKDFNKRTLAELLDALKTPCSETHFMMYEAIRKGATDDDIFNATAIKPFYSQQMRELVELEEQILKHKVESRCGALCAQCKYREPNNCKGCVNIDKPFWAGEGTCDLKYCCETKGHRHCGECAQFPCATLKKFVEQGHDVNRIEQCKAWRDGNMLPDDLLARAKKDGFSDKYLAKLLGVKERSIREQRERIGVVERWCAVPVSGVENQEYYYSTYN